MDILYREKLSSKYITSIFLFFASILLFCMIYQVLIGPLGNNPAPNWLLAIIFLFFIFLALNFLILVVKITSEFLIVGYGIFKHKINWKDVENVYRDKASVVKYGGWGIRFGKVEGIWRLVYNIPESDRIVLKLKKGNFREFVFSTKNSENVLKLIKEQIEK